MATRSQVQMLQILRRDAGVKECARRADRTVGCCEYHDRLRTLGVASSTDLDNHGVDALKRWLVGQGARDTTTRHIDRWRLEIDRRYDRLHALAVVAGDAGGFATQAQRWAFNERQCGLKWPQTSRHGQLIIEGQKHVEARLLDEIVVTVMLAILCTRAGVRVDDLFVDAQTGS
ncbi:MAG: hypothetical protein ACXW5U_19965 [Thermoanaerobaculia bacterium]